MTRTKAAVAAMLIAGAAFVAAIIAPSSAEARGPLYGATYPSKITGKLWSGISNTAFCWVEIPIEINREIQHTDPFTGSVVGLGRGVYFTGQRLVLGVVDVVTFPIDVYGNNFDSIQRTEFPFIDEVE